MVYYMVDLYSKEDVCNNIISFLNGKGITISELRKLIITKKKKENLLFSTVSGSFAYGAENIFSDIDLTVIVNQKENKSAHETQYDINGTRIDLREVELGEINVAIKKICSSYECLRANEVSGLGIDFQILKRIERLHNGIIIHNNMASQLVIPYLELRLVLIFKRIGDIDSMLQDVIGARKSNQLLYSYSRTIDVVNKLIDLFLVCNGYCNVETKSRVLILERKFQDHDIYRFYKDFLFEHTMNHTSTLASKIDNAVFWVRSNMYDLSKVFQKEISNGK